MPQTVEVVKEIRFAVVMYGGVSLAIYINGVAQELLKMVRATAVVENADGSGEFSVDDVELDEVDLIYRDLAYLLAQKKPLLFWRYKEWLKDRRRGENPLTEIKNQPNAKIVRFVVDILSGSSAGGINGVYMAKALACGQDLHTLENLWIKEGSFSRLLRDEQSVLDADEQNPGKQNPIGLKAPENPPSLLNSDRMYLKLLRAFYQMNAESAPQPSFVDEIDLFVTMTDFWGIPMPIRLYDQLIYERRHRQHLHFRFRKNATVQGKDLNEFESKLYPFLAFSARCTSSFPLAFDPMQLEIANRVIREVNDAYDAQEITEKLDTRGISRKLWERSFRPATVQDANGENIELKWDKRVFVDGGYLDNKPFGYAIEALDNKQADVLIDRKLVYVEPEPDLADNIECATNYEPPLAIKNTMAAVTEMPRYETIREDLQQVLQRNRLITRVEHVVSNARRDELSSFDLSIQMQSGGLSGIIGQYKNLLNDLKSEKRYENGKGKPIWQKLTLGELAQQKGKVIYPYYRLRVSALNDDLARMITRRAGFDENSDYFIAIRDLVRAWRKANFDEGENGSNGKSSPLQFLYDYDYNYRLRRLRFVLQQADRLLEFDENLIGELKQTQTVAQKFARAKKNYAETDAEILKEIFPLVEGEVFTRPEESASLILLNALNDKSEELEQIVRDYKKRINNVHRKVRQRLREIDPNEGVVEPESNELRMSLEEKIQSVIRKLGVKGFEELLGKNEQNDTNRFESDFDLAARDKRARFVIEDYGLAAFLNEIGEKLRKIYNAAPEETENKPESIFAVAKAEALNILNEPTSNRLKDAVRVYLLHFYESFDAYDQIIFPITYETPIGEAALVDVARISPLDATSLIDELKELRAQNASPKDSDGNPAYKARRKLAGGVFRAFGAFFAEDWRKNDILWGRLDAAERLVSIVSPDKDFNRELVEEIQEIMLESNKLMRESFEGANNSDESENRPFIKFVKERYSINRRLPEDDVVETASRSLAVLQKVVREAEIGSLAPTKNFAVEALISTLKAEMDRRDAIAILKPYIQTYLVIIIIAYIAPLAALTLFVGLFFYFRQSWLLIAGIILAVVCLMIPFIVIDQAGKIAWRKANEFLKKVIMKNVTGN